MTKRIQTILKLAAISGFGPSRTRKLFRQLQQDGTQFEFLTEFNREDLVSLGLDEEQANQFLKVDVTELSEQLAEQGLEVVTILDESTPKKMVNSKSSPWYFYVGRLDILDAKSIGFAGSRDASDESIELTTSLAGAAVGASWSVISGGARGVDIAAHKAALESGGTTTILLPQGIATWSLPEDLDLDQVLILSEFLPLDEWGAYRAMQRNKSVVELSDLLVIPQSGDRGGTFNAGEYAIKQKHPVFVADAGEQYLGNRKLIELGATPLEWAGDFATITDAVATGTNDIPSQTSLF